MKIYQELQEIRKILIGYKCDICNKEVIKVIEITTGHNSWDNDSIDSIENFDVCSFNCMIKGIKEDKFNFDFDYDDSYFIFRGRFNKKQINEIKEKDK